MPNVLESYFASGFMSVFGSPEFIGVGIVSFFTAAVLLTPTHPALKAMAFFGGVILALPFLGWGALVLSLGGGVILYFAFRRLWG